MGLSDEFLVDPHEVSDTLRCPVCMDLFDDPVFCGGRPCQHVFCRECIELALERSDQCPVCRATIEAYAMTPHQAINALLDEVKVRCKHRCGWQGRRDERPDHEPVCPVALLEASKAELAAYCERHASIDQKLEEKDMRIKELEAALMHKDATVVKTGHELLARQVQVAELEQQVSKLSRQLDNALRQLEERNLQLAVYQSIDKERERPPSAAFVEADPNRCAAFVDSDPNRVRPFVDADASISSTSASTSAVSAWASAAAAVAADLGSTNELEESRWDDPEGFASLPTSSREAPPEVRDNFSSMITRETPLEGQDDSVLDVCF